MIFRVGIENNNDGRSIAWALEHPGCFAYGGNASSACVNLEKAIQVYATWILKHEANTWLNFEEVEIHPEETWDVYFIDDNLDKIEGDGYSVESFFRYDWKPLRREEVGQAIKMLSWSRVDLLKTISGLSAGKLDATYPAERWSINGILGHIGGAEWWYLERLGQAIPKAEVVKDPLARLKQSRDLLNRALPRLIGVSQVVGLDGEFWSPRKVLRRAMWHELDHIRHIQKLI
ncbi:MAG: hypothetical protein A2X25_00895 [Chloroflexi bacterium GWB2_49_20]|nr:MAG: hypothetical protein A2X25_00895 [Chloroflexi bacterium GWB2_49_20]OGN77531.1 MAG: hypothetical protein A2X26_02205 [Chloroflexi bacterium GWC2_49_37]OGN83206.1 MAG: hypothetical protein A2X27_13515 [Chloroflexi bacterium GWD2_49_16]